MVGFRERHRTVMIDIGESGDVIRFRVRVTPRARSSGLGAVTDGILSVRVAAPPLDGRANDALRDFLARVLNVRGSSVQISSGDRSRHKIVEVRGITRIEALRRLAGEDRYSVAKE